MEKLKDYLESVLQMAKGLRNQDVRKHFYHQAFGAVSFFTMATFKDNRELEEQAMELWNDYYRHEFEKLIYGE